MFKAQAEVTSLWNPHNNGDCYRAVGCFCIKNIYFMLRFLLAIKMVLQVDLENKAKTESHRSIHLLKLFLGFSFHHERLAACILITKGKKRAFKVGCNTPGKHKTIKLVFPSHLSWLSPHTSRANPGIWQPRPFMVLRGKSNHEKCHSGTPQSPGPYTHQGTYVTYHPRKPTGQIYDTAVKAQCVLFKSWIGKYAKS